MIMIMFLEKWQSHYQCLRPTVCRAVKTKTSSSFLLVIRQPGPPPSGKHLNQYEEAAEPYLTRGRKTLAARRLEEGETFPRSENLCQALVLSFTVHCQRGDERSNLLPVSF